MCKKISVFTVCLLFLLSVGVVAGEKGRSIVKDKQDIVKITDVQNIGPPLAADYCNMGKAGVETYYWSSWVAGEGCLTFYDPAVECAGVPTYPFEIVSISFSLFDDGSGMVWPVDMDFVVYDMADPTDFCQGPGAELCRETFSCDQANFSYPMTGFLTFSSPCCVNRPVFIGLEYTGTTSAPYPSVLFDSIDPVFCDCWWIAGGTATEWHTVWGNPSPVGYPVYWVDGETNSANCAPPWDNHKMHWPQLPDLIGWDVNATTPIELADDWRCSATGMVEDIHFWGSWKDQDGNPVTDDFESPGVVFTFRIYSDMPADDPQNPFGYSVPDSLLWSLTEWVEGVPSEPPTLESWFDPTIPWTNNNDHVPYWRYDYYIPPSLQFLQQQGTIYWLGITAELTYPAAFQWGWKNSRDHFNDDAVWRLPGGNWVEMYEPPRFNRFGVYFDSEGYPTDAQSTNFYGSGWYFYPQDFWWNIWFYDNPFTYDHPKQIFLNFFVEPTGPVPSITFALNYTTPLWSQQGNPPGDPRRPPLPGDFEDPPIPETDYIVREILPVGITGQYTFPITIPYNPEWVSIDIIATDVMIMGDITHECVGTSLDLAFVITGEGEEPPPDTCTYYKQPYPDYAPNGMPDFDQKQDNWITPFWGNWSYCGPVALADCFWWFDSKYQFEIDPTSPPPPAINDDYSLVQSYAAGQWDDHDTNNVMPFVQNLATYCMTDMNGVPGTVFWDLVNGTNNWITDAGLAGQYSVTPVLGPDFGMIRNEILISQDVILLLGFYEIMPTGGCQWIGGHYVTCAGVCETENAVCVSDPMFDGNEGEPPAGSAHGSAVHNDAFNVSGPHGTIHHDRYNLTPNQYPCPSPATWMFTDYPASWLDLMVFEWQNPIDPISTPPTYMGGELVVLLDAALIICPVEIETGACCFPDGSCQDLNAGDCANAGGIWGGLGTFCQNDNDIPPNYIDDACEGLYPMGACCFSDQSCVVTYQPACEVIAGGQYMGDGTDCSDLNGNSIADICEEDPTLKWRQRPDLAPTGMDVTACQHWLLGQKILADDFECTQTGPITEIVIWGSWNGDILPAEPPEFILSFHSDIPANPPVHSMPGELLWLDTLSVYEEVMYAGNLEEGWFHPPDTYMPNGDTQCWMYRFTVFDEPFIQHGSPDNPVIYWLDVQLVHDYWMENALFGWKTSLDHWNDDAVWIEGIEPMPGGPPHPWNELIYPIGHPMEGLSIDLAFEIRGEESLTGACCFPDGSCQDLNAGDCANAAGVWGGLGSYCQSDNDIPPNYIDDACEGYYPMGACCFTDQSCIVTYQQACEVVAGGQYMGDGTDCTDSDGDLIADICEEDTLLKWEQLPDLEPTGMDVYACNWWLMGPTTLADDFECTRYGPITEIVIWGSWYADVMLPTPVEFVLSFHADIPASENPYGDWSVPGELLWLDTLRVYEEILYADNLNEGFFIPPDGYEPNADTQCWMYRFTAFDEPFIQHGSPENPVIYWLDVQVLLPFMQDAIFGWKTSLNHWNDDAVWIQGSEPFPSPQWSELIYPEQHPMHPQSIDLAFRIYGESHEPPTGACCHGDPTEPTCTNTSEWNCINNLLGTWYPDEDCDDPTFECPVAATGACCLTSGICEIMTESECENLGADYLGDNTICLGDLNENGINDACEDTTMRDWFVAGDPDYGDDPYVPVAWHRVQRFEWLGDRVDKEAMSMPDDNAAGILGDDDCLLGVNISGGIVTIRAIVTTNFSALPAAFPVGSNEYVDVWIDWNNNNFFEHPGEHIGTWSADPNAGWPAPLGPDATIATIAGPAGGPADALYNIRVRLDWHDVGSPHVPNPGDEADGDIFTYDVSYGEVEDSRIFVWDHKMHYPQLPDESGWDVLATEPVTLADDWRCTESGWIKDIHFWGSWIHGIEGEILGFNLSIHLDIPASPPDIPFSKPGELVREFTIPMAMVEVTLIESPVMEGWYDPVNADFLLDNHNRYYRYDILLPETDWIEQNAGTIYWLDISAQVAGEQQWGWKSSINHWNDDAVWIAPGADWTEMYEPPEYEQSLDLSFVITGDTLPPATDFEYLPGDANMYNGAWAPQTIGSDVTYLVNYFKGITTSVPCLMHNPGAVIAPVYFWASADVNGDCNVIGSDVTRLVAYFRGAAAIVTCSDYPPSYPPIPPAPPAGWPNCQTPPALNDMIIPTVPGNK